MHVIDICVLPYYTPAGLSSFWDLQAHFYFCFVQMQAAYDDYNDHARSSGKSRGHFIVDLCRPGHLTICLRNFQERIKCNDDNWDAQFGKLTMSSELTLARADCRANNTPLK